mmetsp:Transcript_93727/g.183755  ORF Transcript_93727/g.183755 Transcript_93727/m.183755 type:complete len:200 (-) Transcript_93727:25-624(-)
MTTEAVFLEAVGLIGVTGAAFAVSSVLSITPFNYSYSRAHNQAIFCAIPAAVYLAYRIYFGICFYISSFTPKRFRYLEWYLSTLLVSGGVSAALFIPMVQPTLLALFEYYIGDLYETIYKVSEPELIKSYNFGTRLLALIVAWFALLFVVELTVRLFMMAIVFLLRTVGILSKDTVKAGNESAEKGVAESDDSDTVAAD